MAFRYLAIPIAISRKQFSRGSSHLRVDKPQILSQITGLFLSILYLYCLSE